MDPSRPSPPGGHRCGRARAARGRCRAPPSPSARRCPRRCDPPARAPPTLSERGDRARAAPPPARAGGGGGGGGPRAGAGGGRGGGGGGGGRGGGRGGGGGGGGRGPPGSRRASRSSRGRSSRAAR